MAEIDRLRRTEGIVFACALLEHPACEPAHRECWDNLCPEWSMPDPGGARLKPILSRSLRPHVRRLLSPELRVRVTVAAP